MHDDLLPQSFIDVAGQGTSIGRSERSSQGYTSLCHAKKTFRMESLCTSARLAPWPGCGAAQASAAELWLPSEKKHPWLDLQEVGLQELSYLHCPSC